MLLSDSELERLQDLLERSEAGLGLEGLDGFATALVIGPVLVQPGEYLPEIFGGALPTWDNPDELQECLNLILRLWNLIVVRQELDLKDEDGWLAALPFLVWPNADQADESASRLFDNVPEDYPLGLPWASGFLRGLQLRADAWQRWSDEDAAVSELLQTCFRLLHWEDGPLPDVIAELGLKPYDRAGRLAAVKALPQLVQTVNRRRRASLPSEFRPQPVRAAAKVGRNEPCPCGSGRKYKRCCGS